MAFFGRKKGKRRGLFGKLLRIISAPVKVVGKVAKTAVKVGKGLVTNIANGKLLSLAAGAIPGVGIALEGIQTVKGLLGNKKAKEDNQTE